MAEFLLANLTQDQNFRLLTGCIVPRPIALVTTRSPDGRANGAPFSFFNVLSYQPDIVALGLGDRRDGSHKDTLTNIRATRAFVVNLVDEVMAERMNVCGIDFLNGEDEIALAALTPVNGFQGDVPRLAESPVSLGCTLLRELRYGKHSIVLGSIDRMWVADGVVGEGMRIDQDKLLLIARLGGDEYARQWKRFTMPRMTIQHWKNRDASR